MSSIKLPSIKSLASIKVDPQIELFERSVPCRGNNLYRRSRYLTLVLKLRFGNVNSSLLVIPEELRWELLFAASETENMLSEAVESFPEKNLPCHDLHLKIN